MRAGVTKAVSAVLALCFPWVSAASGGTVLCFGQDGRVGFGVGNGLTCAAAIASAPFAATAETTCDPCCSEERCADVPGKGLLQRAPPGVAPRRAPAGQALHDVMVFAQTGSGSPAANLPPPAHVLDGMHGMRLRLAALSSVVLRL